MARILTDKYRVMEFHVEGMWTKSEEVIYGQLINRPVGLRKENLANENLESNIFGWP